MGYVESNLLPGEEVVYKARLHPIVYFSAIFWLLVGLVLIVFAPWVSIGTLLGVFLWFVAALEAFSAWLRIANSEFAVTNRRVLIKTGWISRKSLELLLAKIEGIGVEQGGFGRIFQFRNDRRAWHGWHQRAIQEYPSAARISTRGARTDPARAVRPGITSAANEMRVAAPVLTTLWVAAFLAAALPGCGDDQQASKYVRGKEPTRV